MSTCPSCGGSHAIDPALAFSLWLDGVLLHLRSHWKKILAAIPLAFFVFIHGYTLIRYSTVSIHRAAACAVLERITGQNMSIVLHSGDIHAMAAEYAVQKHTSMMRQGGLLSSYRIVLGGEHFTEKLFQK
jgi:hypothetical protein